MTSALNIIVALGFLLSLPVVLVLAQCFCPRSWGKLWLGPALVRGKYWCLDLLAGRVRIDWSEVTILASGAVGLGLLAWGVPRWGWLALLAGQPAWLTSTWRDRRWGTFTLSVYYTVLSALGAAKAWMGA